MRTLCSYIAVLALTSALVASGCSSDESAPGAQEAGSGGASGSSGSDAGTAGGAGGRDAGTGGGAEAAGHAGDAGETIEGGEAGAEGGAHPGRVTLRAQPVDLAWAAFQDASGSWHRLSGTNGVYTFDVVGRRYGVVAVCADSVDANVFVRVIQTTVDEMTELKEDCGAFAPRTMLNVSGTVNGVTGAPFGAVNIAMSVVTFTSPASPPTYDLAFPPGTYDLLAFRATGTDSNEFSLDRIAIDRGVAVQSDLTHDFDLSTAGFAPTKTAHVDVLGVETGEQPSADVRYWTSGGTNALIGATASVAFDYPLIPDTVRAQGDLYYVSSFAVVRQGAAFTTRGAARVLATPVLVGLTPPPAFKATATRIGSTPYVRVRATLPPAAWPSWLDFEYQTVQGAIDKNWSVILTNGWLAGAASYDMPDLSGVPGWTQDFALIGGTAAVDADLAAYNYPRGYPSSTERPRDGDVQKFARAHLTL